LAIDHLLAYWGSGSSCYCGWCLAAVHTQVPCTLHDLKIVVCWSRWRAGRRGLQCDGSLIQGTTELLLQAAPSSCTGRGESRVLSTFELSGKTASNARPDKLDRGVSRSANGTSFSVLLVWELSLCAEDHAPEPSSRVSPPVPLPLSKSSRLIAPPQGAPKPPRRRPDPRLDSVYLY